MYMKNLSLLLLSFFICSTAMAQSPNKIKKEADKLFQAKLYQKSLTEYKKIKDKYAKDMEIKYNIGVCYFHTSNMPQAITYLNFYSKNSNKPITLTYYYLAKAEHYQNNFDVAAHYYKKYLRTLSSDAPERAELKRRIIQCTNGPKIEQINSSSIVTTLGTGINSPYDDYKLCFNPRVPNTVFFSSNRSTATGGKLNAKNLPDSINGTYRSDIYQSTLQQGQWTNTTALSKRYNTSMSEDIISFFDNGYQLLLLKGFSDGHKEIVKENYDEDSIEVILPFAIEASSNNWDGDHFFVSDSLMIFASDRPGGYGGKDLYYSIKVDQIWQTPINLGHQINTEYDEVSPFLAQNGRVLYFSADHPLSMGGYDIYRAEFNDSTRSWRAAKNVGVPINSTADDKDFFLDKDGSKAYFCSNRIEGLGGFDLYSAYFRTPIKAQLKTKSPANFVEVLSNITSLTQNDPTNNAVRKLTPSPNNNLQNNHHSTDNKVIYNISPIYYNAQTGKIEGARNTILALQKLLTRHPEVLLVLSGHADNTGDPINDLYLTVKQAEALSSELIQESKQSQQIWLRGCAQHYPIANNQNFDGTPNILGNKMNRRIYIDVYNIDHLKDKINVNIIAPQVSSVMQNKSFERYQLKSKGLTYRVQVTETPTLFNHPIFKTFPHSITEKQPNDINVKYMVGLEDSFESIKYTWDKIIQQGFSNAQIVPYINGIRITEDEAQVLFTQYSDLEHWLEFRSN